MGFIALPSRDVTVGSLADAEKGVLRTALEEASEITEQIVRIDGPVFSKVYSRIYRVRVANSPKCLAAKVCLSQSGVPDKSFAARQFRELRDVSERMLSASFRVPTPRALFPDQAIIIMDWAEGEELTAILRRRRHPRKALLDQIRQAGLWLRHFHGAGSYREEPAAESKLRDRIHDARSRLIKEGIDRAIVWRALLSLEKQIALLKSRPLPFSWLHGDFQPTNIIADDHSIHGLDIAFSKDGIVLLDVVHFVNFVERFSKMPKGFHLLPRIDEISRNFEEAYFGSAQHSMRLAVLWFQILDNIAFLTRYFRHTKSPFHRTYLVTMVELSIKKCLRSIDQLET